MVECRDFFKSSPVADHSSQHGAPHPEEYEDKEEDHRLELSLALSIHRSGQELSLLKHSLEWSSQSQLNVASASSLGVGNVQLSRDQVWRTLQKDAGGFSDANPASLKTRRWASMQPNMPLGDSGDVLPLPIERSSSNSMMLHRSGVISFLEKSPGMMALSQQPHELLEVQRKKELQAQRRLEARKRRKLLMEGKQQKKLNRQASGSQQSTAVTEDCVSNVGSGVHEYHIGNKGQVRKSAKIQGSEDGDKVNSDLSQEAERVSAECNTVGTTFKEEEDVNPEFDGIHASMRFAGNDDVWPMSVIGDTGRGKGMPPDKGKAESSQFMEDVTVVKEQPIAEAALSGQEGFQGRAKPMLRVPIIRQQSWSVGDWRLGVSPSMGDTSRPSPVVGLDRGLSPDIRSLKFSEGQIKNGEDSRTCKSESDSLTQGSPLSLGLAGKLNQCHGSFPDLPCVSTTGSGPNGKTISGVMYILNGKQVRLVCSCHGNHMSPAEFVQHSGSDDLSNPERSIVVNASPFVNTVPTISFLF